MRAAIAALAASGWMHHVAPLRLESSVECDIVVAGGSLASLAAAVTAANVSSALNVCFLEITDWPGGQMTASGVPAIDFGTDNKDSRNTPNVFNTLLYGPLMPGGTNLGECWVSSKCFQTQIVMDAWVFPLMARFPNLQVYFNTAVQSVTRSANTITSVTAVRRTPASGTTGWEALLSAQLQDWYSSTPSALFPTKETITFNVSANGVVIEATEFGDVLASASAADGSADQLLFAQGIEAPYENSTSLITTCGQAATIPFFMSYGYDVAPSPDPIPQGGAEGEPFGLQENMSWEHAWTYRRSLAVHANKSSDADTVTQGEISNQNIGNGNDYINGYMFYPVGSDELNQQLASPGAWRSGVNITALANAEQRAYGFYHWYRNHSSKNITDYLSLNKTQVGTGHGLTKMPYLRDTRRAYAGLDGYRLSYPDLSVPDTKNNRTAQKWDDTVGIGVYFYADIHKMDPNYCPYPSYFPATNSPVLPYYFPFRSLTVQGMDNLLVAGKSLAQTFHANAATRLHPEEWTTGTAAGAAAAMMVQNGWDTTAVLKNVRELQALLVTDTVGLPLDWTLPK